MQIIPTVCIEVALIYFGSIVITENSEPGRKSFILTKNNTVINVPDVNSSHLFIHMSSSRRLEVS